ncbi:MAG: hydantoinase/oxoprolinase family protein [Gammaproteobacteria bacterium]|nr:hydantoinase/oxoprolinase family protein [Gammaproteobacteria bacterium]
MLKLAVDTGGTFTDLAIANPDGRALGFWKTLSDAKAPGKSVLAGVEGLQRSCDFALSDVSQVIVATTVATNAILERSGGPVGLITTRGFRDVAIIGRGKRHDTYDLLLSKPKPLTERRYIAQISERMSHTGEVLERLGVEELPQILSMIRHFGIQSVAVCLLHAYANPAHEEWIGQWLSEHAPDLDVSLSSDVSPRHREYERVCTTLANAYVRPTVRRFLDDLSHSLTERGFAGEMLVMQSDGGLIAPDVAARYPVRIIESGPAAGVLMCAQLAQQRGLARALTFDMGGTTAKLGAVQDGEPAVTTTFEVDGVNLRQWSGLPLNISAVELIEIGAGGGSIAAARLGTLEVGPKSAGADPGPVAYRRGGTQTTLTDANLALGYLDPDHFAGGRMGLDEVAAREAIRRDVAEPLNLDVDAAAWGVHTVANASMERAMRSMSIERGRDPRDYVLIAFGGAGPLHATTLARALGIPQVIVPYGAGVGSAVGLLAANSKFTVSVTRTLLLASGDAAQAQEMALIFSDLEQRCQGQLGAVQPGEKLIWRRHAYGRYRGQGFQLRIEVPLGAPSRQSASDLIERFHRAYHDTYGYARADERIEVTDWFLTAEVVRDESHDTPVVPTRPTPMNTRHAPAMRKVRLSRTGDAQLCRVVRRDELVEQEVVFGPLLVVDDETTVLVLAGDAVTREAGGDLVITVGDDE